MENTSIALRIVDKLVDKFEPILTAIEKTANEHSGMQQDLSTLRADLGKLDEVTGAYADELSQLHELLKSNKWFYTWMEIKKSEEDVAEQIKEAEKRGRKAGRRDGISQAVGAWIVRHIWKILFGALLAENIIRNWHLDQLVAKLFK